MLKKVLSVISLLSVLNGCAGDDLAVQPAIEHDAALDVAKDSNSDAHHPPQLDSGFWDGNFNYQLPDNSYITYNGGPVLTNPINVYFIWYGDWSQKSATASILHDLISNVGASDYYKTNTVYYQVGNSFAFGDAGLDADEASAPDQSKHFVTNNVQFVGDLYVNYTHGTAFSDSDISTIVAETLQVSNIIPNENNVYFVLTSVDVRVYSNIDIFHGFCTTYCGFHNDTIINGIDTKYAFVGDVEQCPDLCSAKYEYQDAGFMSPPNGDWSADGMASVVMHELSEAVTDPEPINNPAWQALDGFENGDMCAWYYGPLYLTKNGSVANTHIAQRDYLLQQIWTIYADGGQGCALLHSRNA